MKTFDELKTILSRDFFASKRLAEGREFNFSMEQAIRIQQIGRYCFEAEESLISDDLIFLKESLGIHERDWAACKARFIFWVRRSLV